MGGKVDSQRELKLLAGVVQVTQAGRYVGVPEGKEHLSLSTLKRNLQLRVWGGLLRLLQCPVPVLPFRLECSKCLEEAPGSQVLMRKGQKYNTKV